MRQLALAALILAVSGACARPASHPEIRFVIAQAPLSLDPRYATDAASERVNRLIYRQLVDFDARSRAIASLASWVRRDALHYRFSLTGQGRTFHDGSRLLAADVVATYRSLLARKDAPHAAEFANIVRIEAPDDDTVDFILSHPDEQFPARLIIGILPARLIAAGHDFAHHPVGNGVMKFRQWNRVLKLERIADHQLFALEEVRDPTVRVLKLLRGEADILQGDLPPELVAYLRQQPGVEVLESRGTNFSYLGFNLQDPLLKYPLVRRAIALAIDRQALIRNVLTGGSRSAVSILPPEHWAGNADLPLLPYDPQQSRALLAQAGVGLPLKLVLKTSTDAQRVRLATIMQGQMKPAGIDLEIRSLDWGTFYDDVGHGKFQLYGLTWVGIRTPEIYRLAFHSRSFPPFGANRGRLQDAVLDGLIDRQDWPAVTARVRELMPYVPLWYEGQFAAVRRGIAGYRLAPDGSWDGLALMIKRGVPP
ncbi:oligopeptide-binding protein AppA precursor [mine drainage metagenome]|uniref:Oligopeptide-binding protein AppA n=1 Tax=mine drainage metagenome TaxID=410659 RepID=A0A1J5QTZ1_9ZZZZ